MANGLFADEQGTLFLKVKTRGLNHPSKIGAWQDSIFLSQVFDVADSSLHSLARIIDTSTFAKENPDGTYFSDSERIYVYSMKPHPVQFFALARRNATFLGADKEYLVHQGVLYYHGIKVEGLNNGNLSILRFRRTDTTGFHEFITDQKRILSGDYIMDKERLKYVGDISEADRLKIAKHFHLQ